MKVTEPTHTYKFVKVKGHELPGLCDGSHPLVAVFDVFGAQLQRLLVLMVESNGEVILEDTRQRKGLAFFLQIKEKCNA